MPWRKNKDTVKKVCSILEINSDDIITFEDFVTNEFKRPYKEIENNPEIVLLRKAWNISCESLLNVLDGITMIAKRIESIKKTKGE